MEYKIYFHMEINKKIINKKRNKKKTGNDNSNQTGPAKIKYFGEGNIIINVIRR